MIATPFVTEDSLARGLFIEMLTASSPEIPVRAAVREWDKLPQANKDRYYVRAKRLYQLANRGL